MNVENTRLRLVFPSCSQMTIVCLSQAAQTLLVIFTYVTVLRYVLNNLRENGSKICSKGFK